MVILNGAFPQFVLIQQYLDCIFIKVRIFKVSKKFRILQEFRISKNHLNLSWMLQNGLKLIYKSFRVLYK